MLRMRNSPSDLRKLGQIMVGTPFRYRLSQAMFVLNALVIVIMFLAGSKAAPKDLGWWINFSCICVFAITGAIVWPLKMLCVLRAFVPPTDNTRGFEVL